MVDQAEEDGSAHPSAIQSLRLLTLTGSRRSEILKLTWPEVEFERRCLRLRDSKTGPKVVPLGSAALKLLERAPRHEGNPYVCAGSRHGSRYSNVENLGEGLARWRGCRVFGSTISGTRSPRSEWELALGCQSWDIFLDTGSPRRRRGMRISRTSRCSVQRNCSQTRSGGLWPVATAPASNPIGFAA